MNRTQRARLGNMLIKRNRLEKELVEQTNKINKLIEDMDKKQVGEAFEKHWIKRP